MSNPVMPGMWCCLVWLGMKGPPTGQCVPAQNPELLSNHPTGPQWFIGPLVRADLFGQVSGFTRNTQRTIMTWKTGRESVSAEGGMGWGKGWDRMRASVELGRPQKVTAGRRGWGQWWPSPQRATWAQNLIWNWPLIIGDQPWIKLPTSIGSSKKQKSFRKTFTSALLTMPKPYDCVDHNKLWKILKEMGIPDHLNCLLRNL